MSYQALGIITSEANYIRVEGMQDYRPIGAFSFLGRYRVIDFPISNMSNSGIDRVHIYVNSKPRSIAEHIGSGRHYNINSKRGKLQLLFTENNDPNSIYNNDIAAFTENIELIERANREYVVIAPSYMVYRENYKQLLKTHVESGADITLLYHKVDNAKSAFLNSHVLNLNHQKGVVSIDRNLGNTKEKNIFMDTYVMTREKFLEMIKKAKSESSMYTLADIVSDECKEFDVRGVPHKGYFAAITTLRDYYQANMDLLDIDTARNLCNADWPIYTRTTDTCPVQYFDGSTARNSLISNGCMIEGTVENSVLGRSVKVKKGAVIRNSIVLAYTEIGEDCQLDNVVVDKWVQIKHANKISGSPEAPAYVKRNDKL